MRTLLNVSIKDKISIKKLLQKCDWLSVNQMAIKSTLIEAWKMLRFDTCPNIVNDMTKEYSHYTRAAHRGAFCPDSRICSLFVKNACAILNSKCFENIKYLSNISEVKTTIKKHIHRFPI